MQAVRTLEASPDRVKRSCTKYNGYPNRRIASPLANLERIAEEKGQFFVQCQLSSIIQAESGEMNTSSILSPRVNIFMNHER